MKDEAAFDRMVDSLDLREYGRKMICPYLLVAGEMEELATPEDMKAFMDALDCSKEMWLYEGVFHPMGEVAGGVNADIADWILEPLTKGVPAGHNRTVVVPET